MQKELVKAMSQSERESSFGQIELTDRSAGQAVSARRAAKAQKLRRDFLEQVNQMVSGAALCSAVFSPHALIDKIYEDLDHAGAFGKLFAMMLRQGPFLFCELRDSLRPKDQMSFTEIYLNRSDIFCFQEKDYSFALDFAMGLGIAADTTAFFSRIASYMEDNALIAKYLPNRTLYHAQRVQQLYQSAGQIVDLPISELLPRIRETIRRFAKETSSQRWYGEDAAEKLRHQLINSLKLSSEQLQQDLLLSSAFYGIHTLDDLIFKIARIFVQTINSRKLRYDMLNDSRFSEQQLGLIQPEIASIRDGIEKQPPNDYNIVQKRYKETIALLQVDSIFTDKIPKTMLNPCNSWISDWPFAGFTDNRSWEILSRQLHRIVVAYYNTLYKIVFRKSKPIQWDVDSAQQLCEFACNSNLFVDREDIPIAPLVLYSMLRSKTHQLRSLVSKPWNLEECYAKRPLSGQYSIEDRLSIGLYIRLRELFLVHLDVFDIPEDRREKTSGLWDSMYRDMTGYNDTYMIVTDAAPDSFPEDTWAIEYFANSWSSNIDFDIWGFPEKQPSHETVYKYMKAQDQQRGTKSWNHYIKRQIEVHPEWLQEYRQHRLLPWYNAFHQTFLNQCLKKCKPLRESIPLPEYPYPSDIPRMYQLRSKYFPEMVLEEKLQEAMYQESQNKLYQIRVQINEAQKANKSDGESSLLKILD